MHRAPISARGSSACSKPGALKRLFRPAASSHDAVPLTVYRPLPIEDHDVKGIVFTRLEEMVEERFSLEVWDSILQRSGDDGLFLATEAYEDARLGSLVQAAHELTGVPADELIRAFGAYMFPGFVRDHPEFCPDDMSLKQFLLTVDRVIHVEVRKLHPGARVPTFAYRDEADSELTMFYSSPRRLCHLAEGLIEGAAAHFGTKLTLEHRQCMHDGFDRCELHLTMQAA